MEDVKIGEGNTASSDEALEQKARFSGKTIEAEWRRVYGESLEESNTALIEEMLENLRIVARESAKK